MIDRGGGAGQLLEPPKVRKRPLNPLKKNDSGVERGNFNILTLSF
jgi:hypothetical protein